MKKDFEISYAVVLYFIMSMIFQVFFVNPKCESVPGSNLWSCFYYVTEHGLVAYLAWYVLKHTSRTINMISAFSLLAYQIGIIIYFGFLFFKPDNYLTWSSSKEVGIIMSLVLWVLGLFISVVKYSK